MRHFKVTTLASGVLLLAISCGGATKKSVPYKGGLEDYIRRARATNNGATESAGSLWSDQSQLANAVSDLRARNAGDIVTINVIESTSALIDATTDTSRTSDADAAFPNFFGAEGLISELANPLDGSSNQTFAGDGETTRTSRLQTNVTASVVERFPNGYLLIEGNRQLLVNGERQIVLVRGVVRPEDISPSNSVFSTSIAELEVEVHGKGIVTRAQKPGALYQLLQGFWPF